MIPVAWDNRAHLTIFLIFLTTACAVWTLVWGKAWMAAVDEWSEQHRLVKAFRDGTPLLHQLVLAALPIALGYALTHPAKVELIWAAVGRSWTAA